MASTFSCGVVVRVLMESKWMRWKSAFILVTGPDIHCVSIYCGLLPSWSWGCTSPSVGTVGFLSPSTFSLLFLCIWWCMLIHNDQFCCKIHKLSSELGRIHTQTMNIPSLPHKSGFCHLEFCPSVETFFTQHQDNFGILELLFDFFTSKPEFCLLLQIFPMPVSGLVLSS